VRDACRAELDRRLAALIAQISEHHSQASEFYAEHAFAECVEKCRECDDGDDDDDDDDDDQCALAVQR
jgi:hypothetical protein